MKRLLQITWIGFILILNTVEVIAQTEPTLYFMSSVPQSTYLNPSFSSNYKSSFGLPGSSVYLQYGNNGFTYNDFVMKQNGVLTADLNKLYGNLKDKNYLMSAAQVDLLHINLKLSSKFHLMLNATAKTYSTIMFPKELAGIFINGTTPLVNTSTAFSMEGESLSYTELGIGGSYQATKKLAIGARLKVLTGLVSGSSQSATGKLAVDDNYGITLSSSADIRTSGYQTIDKNKFSDYLKNSGVAFDLGGSYQLLKNLTISASVLDIGSISWKNDLYSYKLDSAKAKYTFRGIDLQQVLNGNSDYLSAEGDSLKRYFTFQESATSSYSTMLPGKVYLGARYNLREKLSVGGLVFAEQFRGRFSPGFSASLQKDFGRVLSTSVSYTIKNGSFDNLGAGLSLNLSPVQLYLVGDNLLNIPISLLKDPTINSFINGSQNFNFRFGLNFVWGREKTVERKNYTQKGKGRAKPKTYGR